MNPLADTREKLTRLSLIVGQFDPRNRWLGWARTIMALGQLSILLFTSPKALFVPVAGQAQAPICKGVESVSLFCIGGPQYLLWHHWGCAGLLLVVASGYRPRYTALLHCWLSASLAFSIALPDGGDSVAKTASLMLVFVCLADDRRWHWSVPSSKLSGTLGALAFAALVVLRVQIAFIYLDSAISKFGVNDWVNGTAEYYFVRDPMFGTGGPFSGIARLLTYFPASTLLMTWTPLVIETAIGILILGRRRYRLCALWLDVALHVGITAFMGLWSFSSVMIACATAGAMPDDTGGRSIQLSQPKAGQTRPPQVNEDTLEQPSDTDRAVTA